MLGTMGVHISGRKSVHIYVLVYSLIRAEYILITYSQLEKDDHGSKVMIARTHCAKLGLLGAPRPASLNIFASGMPMKDMIVMTWVCEEERVRERNTIAANNAAVASNNAAISAAVSA